jgi:iron(III) transport system substrate-binding protein
MTRIRLALLLAASILPARAAEPGEAALYAAAKAEGGQVVWYLNQPLEPLRLVADEFQKQYPGVRVQLQRGIGAQLMQKFVQETEAKQNLADVVQISDPIMMQDLADKGMLAHWRVPTFDRIPASFRMGDQGATVIATEMAILYNPTKLSAEEVALLSSDWNAVLDPRFKGRFAVVNGKCGVCYAGFNMFLDPALKDRYGVAYLTKVAQQKPAIYADPIVGMDRVIAGEHDFLFWHSAAPAAQKLMAGAPIRWLSPSPQPMYPNTIQSISATAPHPNGARLFQNWMTSDAGVKALQEKYGPRTVLADVPDAREIAKLPWMKQATPYDVDLARWRTDYDSSQDLWIRILRQNR